MGARTVTRADLCEAVYRRVGLSRTESVALVEVVLDQITDSLVQGETVKLSSFGSFVVRSKGQRIGRNPPPVLVTRREDALKMVRSAMLLSSAFPELKDQAVSLSTRLGDLQRVPNTTNTFVIPYTVFDEAGNKAEGDHQLVLHVEFMNVTEHLNGAMVSVRKYVCFILLIALLRA